MDTDWSSATKYVISVYYAPNTPSGANLRFEQLSRASLRSDLDFAFIPSGNAVGGVKIRNFFTHKLSRHAASLILQLALANSVVQIDAVPFLPFRKHFLLIHDCGNLFPKSRRSGPFRAFLYRLQLKLVRNLVTVSQSTARTLRLLGYKQPTVVAPNSTGWASAPVTSNAPRDIDFLFVTSGAHHKRDAVAHNAIRGAYPNAIIYMVGADLRVKLEGQLAGPPPIFVNKPNESELKTLYRRSRVYVTYSRVEGFGMTVLEAINSGCLCLISDIPSFREFFGGAPSVRFLPKKRLRPKDVMEALGQAENQRLQSATDGPSWDDILRTLSDGFDSILQAGAHRHQ